jgi:uncharacterized protein YqhQ
MATPDEPLRLGGMALQNGLLVHGPTHWAAAVRDGDGEIRVASGRKGGGDGLGRVPVLRGVAKLAEAVALLPRVRRSLPEARLAFESPTVVALTAGSAAVTGLARRSRLSAGTVEGIASVLALLPALGSLRSQSLARYHGAEHKVIGAYEHGGDADAAPKEHERCGSHLVGPLIATTVLGNLLASRAPEDRRSPARLAASLASSGVAVEVFGWMVRNRTNPVARLLAVPGTTLQRAIGTREPRPEELDVANAALARLLELERVR